MSYTQAKYHHLIPQTYYSAWEHGKGTLFVKNLSDNRISERNKNNIAGIRNYHSIIAGMPIVTKEDADIIFEPLKNYIVIYNEREISDPLEYNKLYYDFDNWIITRKDGSVVSKKSIKAEIDKIKIKNIETLWASKYESFWPIVREELSEKIINASNNYITEIHLDYLMRFYTALDWRSIESNSVFIEAWKWLCVNVLGLDKIEIPEQEREKSFINNAAEEIKHNLLLNYYRQYLYDKGIIYDVYKKNLEKTTFCFLVADGRETFFTSDNPVFIIKRKDGYLQGILPITPRILMVQCKNNNTNNEYCISHINDREVIKYNLAITKNANSFTIQEDNNQ